MTSVPITKDYEVFDLTGPKVKRLDGSDWVPHTETPLAVVAEPDALAPAKKKGGRPKGSKNGGKTKKAKSAKAKLPPPPVDHVPETQAPVQSLRIAAGGEGMLSRVRRITADQWVWILIPVAAIGLALSLAFLTGALKP